MISRREKEKESKRARKIGRGREGVGEREKVQKLLLVLCPCGSPLSSCFWLGIITVSGCWLLYIIKTNNNTNKVSLPLVNIKMQLFWKLIKNRLIYGHLQ